MSPAAENPDSVQDAQLHLRERELAALQLPRLSPLSFPQRRLWFLHQLEPDNPRYNMSSLVRLTGALDLAAFESAINCIVARHEILRTRFVLEDGEPVQVIAPELKIATRLKDLSASPDREQAAESAMLEELNRPFDLSAAPLLRCNLFKLNPDEHLAFFTMHHIIWDEWSFRVFHNELIQFYTALVRREALDATELPIQYADYAEWQREWLQGDVFEKQIDFWKEQLRGNPASVELPTDFPRRAAQSPNGDVRWLAFSPELGARLKDFARSENATLFMVLLAAFKALLYRYTRQEDVVVGSPVAGRNQVETEGLIGFFVNTLALRSRVAPSMSFNELLAQVRDTALAAFSQQDVPFDKIVEVLQPERALDRTPFINAMFFVQHEGSTEPLSLPGLQVEYLDSPVGAAKFDITFLVRQTDRDLTAVILYNPDLFAAATIDRLLEQYVNLLESAVADPAQRISHLPLLSQAERQRMLVDWNATRTEYPRQACAHELFEEQARLHPNAVAVQFGNDWLSYRALNERANRVAHRLIKMGVKPGAFVGLCSERSLEMLVAILGILKAGAAYAPLDPALPKQRLAGMLKNLASPAGATESDGHSSDRAVSSPSTPRSGGECPSPAGAGEGGRRPDEGCGDENKPCCRGEEVPRAQGEQSLDPRPSTLTPLSDVRSSTFDVRRSQVRGEPPSPTTDAHRDHEPSQRWIESHDAHPTSGATKFLPLPKGEGRGEGEVPSADFQQLASTVHGKPPSPTTDAHQDHEPSQRWIESHDAHPTSGATKFLPLPKGEGRGEGEVPSADHQRVASTVRGKGKIEPPSPALVLTHQRLAESLPDSAIPTLALDTDDLSAESSADPRVQITSDTIAYISFTSGSTGQPKGVCVTHRAIVRLVRNTNYAGFEPSDVFLQFAPLAFDASTFEIWGALLNGARLAVMPPQLPSLSELAAALRRHRVTTAWFTSGLFNQIVDEKPEALQGLRQVLTGGDVLSPAHIHKALAVMGSGALINGYGPTENATFTACYRIPPAFDGKTPVPIGRPISNTTCYVLDENLQPVPIGVPGELYTGGDGLAAGYLQDAELTAQKFVANPFQPGERLYRTGDIVRWLADGNLEFIGRNNDQVKVRGFRIELGEIESAILEHPAIRQCAVTAQSDATGTKQIIAYIVSGARPTPGVEAMQAFLAERLPDYMLPAFVVALDELPLSRNGKVDRAALPPPERGCSVAEEIAVPRDELESELQAIWERVLNVKPIGIHDRFFALGGHSLLAIRLLSLVERKFGRQLKVAALFQHPTIAGLAKVMRGSAPARASSIVEIQPHGSRPPLFLVHGAGGGMFWGYSNLAKHLGNDQPLYAFKSRGLDGEEELDTVEQLADSYLADLRAAQPNGPYRLGGYCFGGIVAYEMSCRLRQQGEDVAFLGLINSTAPNSSYTEFRWTPRTAVRFGANVLHRAYHSLRAHPEAMHQFVYWKVRALFKANNRTTPVAHSSGNDGQMDPDDWVDLSQFNEEEKRVWRKHLSALAQYQPRPYPGHVWLFRSPVHLLHCSFAKDYGWGDLACGGVTVRIIHRAHEAVMEEPGVRLLASALQASL